MKIDPVEMMVEIERDPGDVFEYLRDSVKEREWSSGAIEVHVDPPGPAEVGTRIKQKRKTPFGTQSITMEVHELDTETHTIASVALDGMLAGTTVAYKVEGGEGFSQLHVHETLDLNGIAGTLARAGLIRNRIGRSLSDDWSKDLATLARLLEQG